MSVSMNSESIWMSAASLTNLQTGTRSEDSSSTQEIALDVFAKRQEIQLEVEKLPNRPKPLKIGACGKAVLATAALCCISGGILFSYSWVSIFSITEDGQKALIPPNWLGFAAGPPLCVIAMGIASTLCRCKDAS